MQPTRVAEVAGSERQSFAEVSGLVPTGPGCFAAEVSAEWTIMGKPNGGYLLAVLGRAAQTIGVHPHVVAASAHYVRSPDPGPVAVEAEVLRAGRTATQVRARMSQHGHLSVEALLTTGRLDADDRPYWSDGLPDPGVVPVERCVRLESPGPTGAHVAMLDQVEIRLDPATAGFRIGRPAGRGELRGWLALPDDEPFDPASLVYAVDAFPPATFDVELSGWVPTFELTAYVRALPRPGPVWVLQRAQLIAAQRVDETCFVWDVDGRMVAQGTQLAGIRLG
jgi:hypothetical protein